MLLRPAVYNKQHLLARQGFYFNITAARRRLCKFFVSNVSPGGRHQYQEGFAIHPEAAVVHNAKSLLLAAIAFLPSATTAPLPSGRQLQVVSRDSISVLLTLDASPFAQPLRQVIRDTATFARLWRQSEGRKPPPRIDFRMEDVIVVALGRRSMGGFEIRVREIRSTPAEVSVYLDLLEPGAECPVAAEVQAPAALVRHRRAKDISAKTPVKFYETVVMRRCEP